MTLKSIIGLSKAEILALTVADIGDRIISKEELFYTAKMLGAHWRYNYEAAKAGKPGLHALLKSLRHSDQFFVSKILLAHKNIREIIADQLVKIYYKHGGKKPGAIAGIPDGATELGRDVASIMGVPYIEMEKVGGKIKLVGKLEPGQTLLLIEDFCTRGTGFIEAVKDILSQFHDAEIIRLELVILNRGGLNYIEVELDEGNLYFDIVALVTEKIDDWDADSGECEPCKYGSTAIKPKASPENWELINTAQL